ncbi:NifU N-terminal domain-containing protein [Paenibacillus cellulositrophicus]|uniref:Scaffold protein Nfu/NifU N-terminal domain-containing protein n=1 Tax=Paenibacillus favisporus TaxID=221028 RepID=A0ABV2FA57_9BACL|nr:MULTISPECIES: NifU N-terminal domain-containing protein [Paenibacillus]MCM3001607.1 NifU N-terminal domain-containing protein [Paenibacillus cellulositrophicus]RED32512.1 scaffold Nfu/NifU family protein [Paenibacillus sp. VMFN-D1]
MAVSIQIQQTPNPHSLKVNASQSLFEGPKSTSLKKGDDTDHPLASALLSIDGVDNIFGIGTFVTVSKMPDADWDNIVPKIEEAFTNVYGE